MENQIKEFAIDVVEDCILAAFKKVHDKFNVKRGDSTELQEEEVERIHLALVDLITAHTLQNL